VERNTEMFQIGRKLILFSKDLRLFFAGSDVLQNCVGRLIRINPQTAQDVGRNSVGIGEKCYKKIIRFNLLSAVIAGTLERPVEKFPCGVGNVHLATSVLATFSQFLVEHMMYGARIDPDRLQRLPKHRVLYLAQRRKNVLDREKVMIAAL